MPSKASVRMFLNKDQFIFNVTEEDIDSGQPDFRAYRAANLKKKQNLKIFEKDKFNSQKQYYLRNNKRLLF